RDIRLSAGTPDRASRRVPPERWAARGPSETRRPRSRWRGIRAGDMLVGMADVTQLLCAIEAGDPRAAAELLPLVYEELRKLAAGPTRRASTDPPAARLVELRYFAGLTMAQAAEALGVPLRTAERNWAYARAWLHRVVAEGAPSDPG